MKKKIKKKECQSQRPGFDIRPHAVEATSLNTKK